MDHDDLSAEEAEALSLKRQIAWDLFPHGDELAGDFRRLGLSLGSEEVQELEHRDSHIRMEPCMYLGPEMNRLVGVVSEVLTDFILSEHADIPEEIAANLGATHKSMFLSATGVVVSHLIGAGLLKLT